MTRPDAMLTVFAVLTGILAVLYMTAVVFAAVAAITARDPRRRSDARKVLAMLLSPLLQYSTPVQMADPRRRYPRRRNR